MARRRRARRNRRRNNHRNQYEDVPANNSITTTPVTRNAPLTPIQNVETPRILRSKSVVLRKMMNIETVRTRSNSFVTPKNRYIYNNLNCTNLNSLFEERVPDVKSTSNLLLDERSNVNRLMLKGKRSASSIPKLHSPEKPVKVDVATQTVYYNNSIEKNCVSKANNETHYNIHTFAQIFETPKIPQNLSPAEFSIFAPQYQASSTPVNNCSKENNLFTNMAKNLIHSKRMAMRNSLHLNCTPKHVSKPSLNRLTDNVVLDKNKLYSINKHRFYKSMSPNIHRNTYIKLCNIKRHSPNSKSASNMNSHSNVPKSFSPMGHSTLERSDNFLNVGSGSVYTKVMARIRNFHRKYSSKWAEKFYEVCLLFGLTIRKGLSAIYKPKNLVNEEQSVAFKEAICSCKYFYEAKVDELERKMQELRENCDKEVGLVKQELGKIYTELTGLLDLKGEIAEIKSKLKNGSSSGTQCRESNVPPPPPPPPPMLFVPPPPPPPMPLSTSTPVSRIIRIPKGNRESKKENEEARPVISLDDILKVKLRKPGDRQQQTPRLQRRNTQPVVSMDMLKKVKLRPASRTHTPSFADISNSSTLSTSPASSLTRILSKVDTNVCRVKRLKRVGAYSSDDISRKTHGFRREFNGVRGPE